MQENPEPSDQEKRETIPSVKDLPTGYRPMRDLVMVKMLPNPERIGKVLLPENNSIVADACEGHVMAKGPRVSDQVQVGDCITFEKNYAVNMELDDGSKFTLLPEQAILLSWPVKDLADRSHARKSTKR